ncbi:MAG: mandelate racemase/muconate lactonizing enzyme family protein [Candidatus Latescibacterota bacterium]|nr:mandelate racemase/muconate lactonizing enzyme family protein [Candidatus Latescibacterota bacterium]
MKITDIKPILTDQYLLVRVYTDAGITGNGESGLWAHHRSVAKLIEEFREYYVGKDPRLIEHHYQTVSRSFHFMGAHISSALSAIDIALWDILGKSVNLPVYQLFGGKCRERARVFDNVGGATLNERVAAAKERVAAGFTTLRVSPFYADLEKRESSQVIGDALEIIAAVREAIGYGIDLGIELHRNLQPDEAITLARALEPYRLKFYEDPLAPESNEAHDYIARHIDVPMALGERSYLVTQFKKLIDQQIAAFIRPDVSLVGGFTQMKKIAAIAEPAMVQLFPHLMGSPVNNAAFTHLAAAIPNYYVTEVNPHSEQQLALVDRPFVTTNGYRELPDRPGIGVEIDEEACTRTPFIDRNITGYFHADGSVAH